MGCWLLLAVPQAEIPNDHGGNAVAALIVGKDVEPLTDATFLQSFANWPGPCGTDPLTPGNHPIWGGVLQNGIRCQTPLFSHVTCGRSAVASSHANILKFNPHCLLRNG